ncbi:MAG: hypothetical protein MJZ56_05275, partial [Bacteroidales bacterium]|nr:hypothetical protein [Bacteroidales bacterium]
MTASIGRTKQRLFDSLRSLTMTVSIGGISSSRCCGEAATPTTTFLSFSNKPPVIATERSEWSKP